MNDGDATNVLDAVRRTSLGNEMVHSYSHPVTRLTIKLLVLAHQISFLCHSTSERQEAKRIFVVTRKGVWFALYGTMHACGYHSSRAMFLYVWGGVVPPSFVGVHGSF